MAKFYAYDPNYMRHGEHLWYILRDEAVFVPHDYILHI